MLGNQGMIGGVDEHLWHCGPHVILRWSAGPCKANCRRKLKGRDSALLQSGTFPSDEDIIFGTWQLVAGLKHV